MHWFSRILNYYIFIFLQLDFQAERYKVLQGNNDGYKKEIASLREKIQKYSTSVAKHEQTINTLRQVLCYHKTDKYTFREFL